jgi:hypothetical protein
MMCGPFAAACARPAAGLIPWHAGRLAGYAILGAGAGAAGAVIPGPAWLPSLIAALFLVAFAAALAGLLPEPRMVLPGFAAAGRLLREGRGPAARFGFGVVNGFIPGLCVLAGSAFPSPWPARCSGPRHVARLRAGTPRPSARRRRLGALGRQA